MGEEVKLMANNLELSVLYEDVDPLFSCSKNKAFLCVL